MMRKEMVYTPAQADALKMIQAHAGDKTHADLIRRLLSQEAARLALVWPDDMPTKKDNSLKGVAARQRKG